MHEGQKFQCLQCEHETTRKDSLQSHMKSFHGCQTFDNDYKSEVDFDIEVDRSKDSKHEDLSDNYKEGIEEYFETDVKSEVESDAELGD